MRIHLAGIVRASCCIEEARKALFVLESFQTINRWVVESIPYWKSFILDSGAFTYMSNTSKGGSVNWEDYVSRYADFIKNHKIKHYIELDIDSIVGLKEVERLRNILENKVGYPSIPVWHKSRGKDEFIRMCRDYKYVAIGGIVTKEFTRKDHKYFPWFIDKAHEMGAEIHGLGYTSSNLRKYQFDSVDSTSWLSGGKYGSLCVLKNKKIKYVTVKGKKISRDQDANVHNLRTWIMYQKLLYDGK
jgi:hypothetical protein